MVLTGAAVSLADRRAGTRELAGLSEHFLSDAELDRKLENWDDVALAWFDSPIDPSNSPFLRLICSVSNLHAAAAIRQGIGGDANLRAAEAHTALAKSIVSAHNRREPEQARQSMQRTRGIGRLTDEPDRGAFS